MLQASLANGALESAESSRKISWWNVPKLTLCPRCKVACRVYCSRTSETGVRSQYRKCPQCRYRLKLIVELSAKRRVPGKTRQ